VTIRQQGKVAALRKAIEEVSKDLNLDDSCDIHVGIAHTRWATHGVPSERNSHPQRSDATHRFIVVHNGIITNYKDIKAFLLQKGHKFESDTDTEVIAHLCDHIQTQHPDEPFRVVIEKVMVQLEGAFACTFKSRLHPGEMVATRRGSPLVVGIKTEQELESDYIPVQYR